MNTSQLSQPLNLLRYLPIIFALTILLNGCGTKRVIPPPYPEYPVQPTPTPIPVAKPPIGEYLPTLGPAKSLYQSARKSLANGEIQKAELTMERALRIEPRNGHYWYTMAEIKYQQQQFDQTVQFCLKSKSLSGKNEHLLALNNVLMHKAKNRSGR